MKRFIKIPNAVFELQLTPMQLLTYAAIVSLKSKENFTRATGRTIADKCNTAPNSVYTAIQELENLGLIKKTNHYENGKRTTNSYKINPICGKFTKIEYSVFDYKLSPSEFAAYAVIKCKANHARLAFPSLNQIARLANICIDTVIKAVRKLETIHIITYSHYVRKCGCFGHNNYTVIDFIKKTITEHQTSSDYILNENKYNNIKHKLKKAGLKFLNNMWYSKFWATILDPLKNVVRKKNKSLFNTQYL